LIIYLFNFIKYKINPLFFPNNCIFPNNRVNQYFEQLNWIRIENEVELSFRINLLKPKNEMEIEFILEHLSKYSKISEKKDVYYLGKVNL